MKRCENDWKEWGNNWKWCGNNWKWWDGNWMRPGVYEVFSGNRCSFHEVKKAGNRVVIAKKCMKKDLMKLGFVSFTRSYFSNFWAIFQGWISGCEKVSLRGCGGVSLDTWVIPTRCRDLHLKQFCLEDIAPAVLIILITHIIIAVRWMLIKILSAVINDWERIKVIVSGGCCLDINIIRKMDLKIKILSLSLF